MSKLESSLTTENADRLSDYVQSATDKLLESWFASLHEKLSELIQMIQQQLEISIDEMELDSSPAFYLGQLAGSINVMKELLVNEKRKQQMIAAKADHGKKFMQIVRVLAETGDVGMRHGELADAVGSTPNSLTGIMKKVLLSGAVDASRSGRNTHYVLTEAGRRYWINYESVARKNPEIDAMRKSIDKLSEEVTRQTQEIKELRSQRVLRPNDRFHAVYHNQISPYMRVQDIQRINDDTYATLDDDFAEGWTDTDYRKAEVDVISFGDCMDTDDYALEIVS